MVKPHQNVPILTPSHCIGRINIYRTTVYFALNKITAVTCRLLFATLPVAAYRLAATIYCITVYILVFRRIITYGVFCT